MTKATDDDDPFNNSPCAWPGCKTVGNPYEDEGWCWWPRYFLWLPEGFCCPAHTSFIEEGHQTGYFKDWPRDISPEVMEFNNDLAAFAPLDSDDGQCILRNVEAEARRASFRIAR